MHTVAVIGASPKPERFSNMAITLLKEYEHEIIPVHPALKEVLELPVYKSISDIPKEIHTLTLYVNAGVSSNYTDVILKLKSKRVIFKPGAENPDLLATLSENGIETIDISKDSTFSIKSYFKGLFE